MAMHRPAARGCADLAYAVQYLTLQIQSQTRLTAFVESDRLIEFFTGGRMEDNTDQWYLSLS